MDAQPSQNHQFLLSHFSGTLTSCPNPVHRTYCYSVRRTQASKASASELADSSQCALRLFTVDSRRIHTRFIDSFDQPDSMSPGKLLLFAVVACLCCLRTSCAQQSAPTPAPSTDVCKIDWECVEDSQGHFDSCLDCSSEIASFPTEAPTSPLRVDENDFVGVCASILVTASGDSLTNEGRGACARAGNHVCNIGVEGMRQFPWTTRFLFGFVWLGVRGRRP
jgi:hypothetical protein